MKRMIESQPTRKKIWWLVLLVPLIYVAVDNLIYPIDEKALLKRTTHEMVLPEMAEEAMEMEERGESIPPPPAREDELPPVGNGLDGWEIFDRIWVRVDRAWPMVLSLLAFVFRKKLVGDPK